MMTIRYPSQELQNRPVYGKLSKPIVGYSDKTKARDTVSVNKGRTSHTVHITAKKFSEVDSGSTPSNNQPVITRNTTPLTPALSKSTFPPKIPKLLHIRHSDDTSEQNRKVVTVILPHSENAVMNELISASVTSLTPPPNTPNCTPAGSQADPTEYPREVTLVDHPEQKKLIVQVET